MTLEFTKYLETIIYLLFLGKGQEYKFSNRRKEEKTREKGEE
jgi:hypothetical protein